MQEAQVQEGNAAEWVVKWEKMERVLLQNLRAETWGWREGGGAGCQRVWEFLSWLNDSRKCMFQKQAWRTDFSGVPINFTSKPFSSVPMLHSRLALLALFYRSPPSAAVNSIFTWHYDFMRIFFYKYTYFAGKYLNVTPTF